MPDNQIPQGGQGFPADNADGTPSLVGKDDYTKWEATQRINKGHADVLVGNLADLQRIGADAAVGTVNVQSAVVAPPGIDAKSKDVITPAQQEAARGEWTRETERTGLVDAPAPNVPAENFSPNPVDPTSTSPTTQASGKSATSATKDK